MKKNLFWLFSILLVVSLACSFRSSETPTPEPAQPLATVEEAVQPTVEPPTAEPVQEEPTQEVVQEEPTLEPTQETSGGDSYTEEFDGDTSQWYTWVAAGDASKNFTELKPGSVVFSLPSTETYAYFANEDYTYENVYVEANMTAKVYGDNGLAVVCRKSDDGWYELRIHTTGQYAGSFEVYRYDQNLKNEKKNPYVNLMQGIPRVFSVDVLNGSKTNTIGLLCSGEYITPIINSVRQTLPKGVEITDNMLTSGEIGVGAMSFANGKVEVQVDSVLVEAH